MKKIFLFIFCFCNFIMLQAEYEGWFLKFSIEMNNGKRLNAHTYIPEDYATPELTDNTADVLKMLQIFSPDDGYIHLFNHLIDYKIQDPENYDNPDDPHIYKLIDEIKIDIAKIKSIRVVKKIKSHDYERILNPVTTKDKWIHTKVLKHEYISGFFPCDYYFYFHEINPEIDKLLSELQEKINQSPDGDGDHETLQPILQKIMKYKVIVIEGCMC